MLTDLDEYDSRILEIYIFINLVSEIANIADNANILI